MKKELRFRNGRVYINFRGGVRAPSLRVGSPGVGTSHRGPRTAEGRRKDGKQTFPFPSSIQDTPRGIGEGSIPKSYVTGRVGFFRRHTTEGNQRVKLEEASDTQKGIKAQNR